MMLSATVSMNSSRSPSVISAADWVGAATGAPRANAYSGGLLPHCFLGVTACDKECGHGLTSAG